MSAIRVFWSRLRGLFSAGKEDRRLDEEIAAHLDAIAAEHERRGMTPAQARLAAARDFGGVTQIKEAYRDRRGLPFLETLGQDVRFGLRQMRANPGFTFAAVLTLALGIGANTAIFRVLDAVVLRSLPVKKPEQLLVVRAYTDAAPVAFSYPLFRELAARQRVLAGMFAVADIPPGDSTTEAAGSAPLTGSLVTGEYFEILGVSAYLGRMLTTADDQRAAPAAAVISYGFWQRVFGGKADALGKTIRVNHAIATIAGVAPPEFFGEQVGRAPDVWLPMSLQPQVANNWLDSPANGMLSVMARLRPGISLERAQSALSVLAEQQLSGVSIQFAGQPNKRRIELAPGGHGLAGLGQRFSAPLTALMGIAGLVLLIACCNLANLLLARSSARAHEIGVRLAIGASRHRILRQLLTESLLLALVGSAIGFAVAEWGARELVALASAGDGWRVSLEGGWRVLAFTTGVAAAASCIFGIAPAIAASRSGVHNALQTNRRAGAAGRSGRSASKAFVIAQVTVSLVLVAGASLLVRSFWNLRDQDFGYRRDGVLMARTAFDPSTFRFGRSPGQTEALYARLNAIPGVRLAALAGTGPLGAIQSQIAISLPGQPAGTNADARAVSVSAEYFETMGIPILAGRAISADDRAGATSVAVLSQTAARRYFGGANPIGRFLSFGKVFQAEKPMLVVGVAHDLRFAGPRDPFGAVVFLALAQHPAPLTSIALRTAADPALSTVPLRQALAEAAPRLKIASIQPLAFILGGMMRQEEMMALLSSAFGLLALALAAVGLYGVVAYAVQRRTQEIGIRLALGATRAQVSGLLLREVGLLAASGLLLGGAATVTLGKSVQSLLFGLTPHDPAMLLLAAAVLSAVALVAGYVPARRAARLDPVHALRQE